MPRTNFEVTSRIRTSRRLKSPVPDSNEHNISLDTVKVEFAIAMISVQVEKYLDHILLFDSFLQLVLLVHERMGSQRDFYSLSATSKHMRRIRSEEPSSMIGLNYHAGDSQGVRSLPGNRECCRMCVCKGSSKGLCLCCGHGGCQRLGISFRILLMQEDFYRGLGLVFWLSFVFPRAVCQGGSSRAYPRLYDSPLLLYLPLHLRSAR
jgi:hypothetical protein